jgi:pimeloyl-ACP methyl ester carboxylesterase
VLPAFPISGCNISIDGGLDSRAMDAANLMVRVADGVRLHVRRWPGRSERVPFLLVHGLSSNARLWDGVGVRLASAGHPAYAVDLRSHGESDRPPAGYDTATAVSDLHALCGMLDLGRAVVAGQSWGGNVAVALTARHPERVAALALVDGGWIDLARQFGSWEECERTLRPPDLDGLRETDLISYIHKAHPSWEEWAIQATVANFRVTNDGRLVRRLPIAEHLMILRSMWDEPPAPDFPKIAVPTLLLPAVPTDHERTARQARLVAQAAAAMPDALVKEYAGADHDLHAQQPARLASDLMELAIRADQTESGSQP